METVEKWGLFEAAVSGKADGNPFKDYDIRGTFSCPEKTVSVRGFYDGDGIWKVRFMPSFEGEYTYCLSGSALEEPVTGTFVVTPPGKGNHGPVRVSSTFHFSYEDGTPYYPLGTTCYVWTLQDDEQIAETLDSLEDTAFNKIRFCVFPKHYDYNLTEPRSYPFAGTPMDSSILTKDNFMDYMGKSEGNDWDFDTFCPEHFRHLEDCILRLQNLGIEADLILFHPYDRWGFSCMSPEQDEHYLNYVLARLSAFRNVWWAMANEYDLLQSKTEADWERLASIVIREDPYLHLRSIHNCRPFYNHAKPWITHASIQRQDLYKTAELVPEWRIRWQKPVVLDEIAYEGNVQYAWGNISPQEMVRRSWIALCSGGYPGHGETYLNGEDPIWWSHGGTLKGESWKRYAFMQEVLKDVPGLGLRPQEVEWDDVCAVPEDPLQAQATGYHLFYYGFFRPSFREFFFDETTPYHVEVLDTWNMTIEDAGTHTGKFRIPLPGREYMAIRIRKA